MLKTVKQKGELSMAPGAVPVIRFSEDAEKKDRSLRLNLSSKEIYEEDYEEDLGEYAKIQKSLVQIDPVFLHHQTDKMGELSDSSSSEGHHSDVNVDQRINGDIDFKILSYLDEKIDDHDERESEDVDFPRSYQSSEKKYEPKINRIEDFSGFGAMQNGGNPMMPNGFNMYSGFEAGAFIFPFNVGQMAFQCPEIFPQTINVSKKKPVILDQTQQRFTGRLKFFDEIKGYGFIVKDDDERDIFCHYDDFCKANINIMMLRSVKIGQVLRVSFSCLSYIGRHNKSKKAVDLEFISLLPSPPYSSMVGMTLMPGMKSMPMNALHSFGTH